METSGLGIIYSCALPDCVTEMVVCGDTPVSGTVQDSVSLWNSETEMGNWFSTALEGGLGETGCTHLHPPHGASKPNFGFVNVGNGYQARMRATMSDGRTCGYDFPPCKLREYKTVSGVSQGTSGDSYRVSFKTGDTTSVESSSSCLDQFFATSSWVPTSWLHYPQIVH